MFKISEFSKLSQVSMRTLRYYDEIGLLKPVHVDSETGYRYYLVEQLSRLQKIVALKDLGFELAQIVQVLDEDLPPEQLRGMFRLKQLELRQRVQAEQERLARVDARLAQMDAEAIPSQHEVLLKKVKPQLVATSRTLTAQFALKHQFASEMLATLRQNGVRQTDSLLFIEAESSDRESEFSIVEVIVPVQSSTVGNIVERSGGRITIRELPGVDTMATLLYHGNPYTLSEAYQPLGSWIQCNDYVIAGPCRQLCLQCEGDLSTFVTEIQFPVVKKELAQPKHIFPGSGKRDLSADLQHLFQISKGII